MSAGWWQPPANAGAHTNARGGLNLGRWLLQPQDPVPWHATRLPTCRWCLKEGQRYVCFLSHFKAEAAAEARYLKDALDRMTACHVYLDSSTLADLRELFASGVDVSEVLVLMLTPGLLTRPWCLLEIRRARFQARSDLCHQMPFEKPHPLHTPIVSRLHRRCGSLSQSCCSN